MFYAVEVMNVKVGGQTEASPTNIEKGLCSLLVSQTRESYITRAIIEQLISCQVDSRVHYTLDSN